jgi:hypothetical protein
MKHNSTHLKTSLFWSIAGWIFFTLAIIIQYVLW